MATQSIVASLLDEPATTELVNTSREYVNQMNKDLAGLHDDFMQFTKKIKQLLRTQKEQDTASGSEPATSEC